MNAPRKDPARPPGAEVELPRQPGISQARRRLLRSSLGAAPVLLAASPRSVMAGQCVTASAQTSYSPLAATSHQPTLFTCSGNTPTFWATTTTAWPSPYVKVSSGLQVATRVQDVFSSSPFGDKTFLEALSLPDTGDAGVVKHMVAAALNATLPSMPQNVVGLSVLRTIWTEYWGQSDNVGRYYRPTAGVKWYSDSSKPKNSGGVIPWLKSTMSG
jgi:hypothetical protein